MSRSVIAALVTASLLGLVGPGQADDSPRRAAPQELVSADLPSRDVEDLLGVALDGGKMLLDKASQSLGDLSARVKEAKARRVATNDLRLIGIAAHNHASANNDVVFPAAITDVKGKPLLSWRVAILPYIEQENLYRQFKLDQPWDSEHNKKLLPLMPRVYAPAMHRAKADPDKTSYRVFTGPKALFDAKGPSRFNIANIPDGTSNTILVVEAGASVPWTKPDELAYDPKVALPKLGGQFRDVFLVLMFDGSVRAVSRSVKEQTLRDAITPDDGNVLGDF